MDRLSLLISEYFVILFLLSIVGHLRFGGDCRHRRCGGGSRRRRRFSDVVVAFLMIVVVLVVVAGLEPLTNLRVLMLGKNRLRKVQNQKCSTIVNRYHGIFN